MLAPICLFTYNRPEETRQTVESLKLNHLAKESHLIVFSDGAKNETALLKVAEVRKYLHMISGFKTIKIIESPANKGLANSIINGVTQIIEKYGKVIVLEDDIVVSQKFLKFMNEALSFYKNDDRVMQISAYMFPINSDDLPDTFFYQANTCWGWATWKRAWNKFSPDCDYILSELNKKKISWKQFNAMQGHEFQKQLIKNKKGLLRTWAVKWHAAIILNNGVALHPKTSYILNIGFNGNGENCRMGNSEGLINNKLDLDVGAADRISNEKALSMLNKYFKRRYSIINKIKRRIISYLKYWHK